MYPLFHLAVSGEGWMTQKGSYSMSNYGSFIPIGHWPLSWKTRTSSSITMEGVLSGLCAASSAHGGIGRRRGLSVLTFVASLPIERGCILLQASWVAGTGI